MIQINNKNNFLFFILFFVLLEGIFFNIQNKKLDDDFKNNEQRPVRIENLLKGESILAKAYSIYDITLGQKIYGKNDSIQMPLASLTKTMAVVVALNNYKENKIISISKNAIKQDGDFGMFANEKWYVYDLAKLTLVSSANDGAYAMLENDNHYLEKMNDKARRLGMNSINFLNSTGLDISTSKAGAFGNAMDANIMATYGLAAYPFIFNATILPEITLESKSGFVHNVKNTNTILDKIPNILFSKTGHTDLAGGNLTIIFRDIKNHLIAITVLGSTVEGRFSDMLTLVNVSQLSYTK